MRFKSAFTAVVVLMASLVVADDNLDEPKVIDEVQLPVCKDEVDEAATTSTVESQVDKIVKQFLHVVRQKNLAFLEEADLSKFGDQLRTDSLQRMLQPLPDKNLKELLME